MNTHKSVLFSGILWLIYLSATLHAQSDYPIGIGDLLDIKVLGVTDFNSEARVDTAGAIQMPFIGEIKVHGLTAAEAQKRIADLLDPDYVLAPQVSIIVKEARSRTYSVVGAVRTPNQYQIVQPISLVGAIAAAGGLDFAKAGDIAQIQRTAAQLGGAANAGASFQVEVNLRKLLFEGDMKLDMPIQPGDLINVPVRVENSVYVIGDITKPGPLDYPTDKTVTITRALAMAGGPTKTSKMKNATLIRQRPDGTLDRTPLNVSKILKGELPDVAMLPNDMLYVPGSVEKSLGWTMLQQVPYMLTWLIIP
jgi:polysaccharide export outer membrane protein